MRVRLLLLGGLALLATLPAQIVALVAERACAGHCRIADSHGSAWRGGGRLFLRSGERWFALGAIDWRLPAPDAYLRLRLDGGEIAWPALRRIEIDGIAVPAAAILGQPALQLPAGEWQGTLRLGPTRLQLDADWPPRLAAGGRVDWRQAASPLLAGEALGDYRLDWEFDGRQGLRGNFAGGRRPAIAGEGQIADGRIEAVVSLDDNVRSTLGPYLGLLGQPVPGRPDAWKVSLGLD